MADPFLPFALPSIAEEEIAEVVDSLRGGWLTTGPKTKRFEQEFAERVGVEHALAVNSATAGLHLALEALGIGPGDQVLTTPYTFTATAEVVRYLGADPLFVDVDPQTFNLDPELVERSLRKHRNVKAMVPVHFAGQPCDMDVLLALGERHGVHIVEDAAHALPASYRGREIGTIGDLTVFSFYATKTITTGEGGMVTTSDDALAARIRTMRLHGINRDAFDRYSTKTPSWYYEVVAPGFKYNMTDIAASLGIHQLRKAEQFRRRREEIANIYNERFSGIPLRKPGVADSTERHAWHLYVIQLALEDLSIDRDRCVELLFEAGIGVSVHFIPLHRQPYWRQRYGLTDEDYPVATRIYERAISLPIYPRMTDADAHRVADAVEGILRKFYSPQ